MPGIEIESPRNDDHVLGAVSDGKEEASPFHQPGQVAAVRNSFLENLCDCVSLPISI